MEADHNETTEPNTEPASDTFTTDSTGSSRQPVILKRSPDTEKKRRIALELCMHYPRKSVRQVADATDSSTGHVSTVLNEYCQAWDTSGEIDASVVDELWQFLEEIQADIDEELQMAEEDSASYQLARGKHMMVRQFQIWLQHFDHSQNPAE